MFSLPSKYLSKDNKSFCLSTKLFLVEGECAAGSMSCHCWGRWSWGSSFSTTLVWHPRRPGGAPRGCDGAMDGLSPTPLLWAHSRCLWRKCGLSGRAGVPEQALSFCSQPSSSCEQSHGGGTMKSPVMCCVTLHPHLSVLLPSSCISGACTTSSVGTGVPAAAHTRGLVPCVLNGGVPSMCSGYVTTNVGQMPLIQFVCTLCPVDIVLF